MPHPDALVKRGCPPWAPSPAVRTVDVWHEYDIPTVGLFRWKQGSSALFTLVGEPEDRLTVWAYVCLAADEADRLEQGEVGFRSVGELDSYLDSLFRDRNAVFVLADRLKIWRWTPVKVGPSILDAATRFLRDIRDSMAETTDPGTRFRAELAGVEVETTELVDA